ncbi:hypothetical protein E3P81_02605 [Wallemia ichthyophaga]|nr:hypothetical protein E3P97_02676 [Wallemia ichthyophaga]TIB31260.1 hypothetical protein E3P85_02329 [Wallemia ichthyophaga]TIB45725.1 hypothetical protein E3P82_02604 [Wallemia ichthyophaga]TIB49175.1 hypothetical protein E3P81_02605 [Wallemia ichthyophaga]TIB52330.1 hypothetical protein E3P80_02606 [Wallemia ichthyophaga]
MATSSSSASPASPATSINFSLNGSRYEELLKTPKPADLEGVSVSVGDGSAQSAQSTRSTCSLDSPGMLQSPQSIQKDGFPRNPDSPSSPSLTRIRERDLRRNVLRRESGGGGSSGRVSFGLESIETHDAHDAHNAQDAQDRHSNTPTTQNTTLDLDKAFNQPPRTLDSSFDLLANDLHSLCLQPSIDGGEIDDAGDMKGSKESKEPLKPSNQSKLNENDETEIKTESSNKIESRNQINGPPRKPLSTINSIPRRQSAIPSTSTGISTGKSIATAVVRRPSAGSGPVKGAKAASVGGAPLKVAPARAASVKPAQRVPPESYKHTIRPTAQTIRKRQSTANTDKHASTANNTRTSLKPRVTLSSRTSLLPSGTSGTTSTASTASINNTTNTPHEGRRRSIRPPRASIASENSQTRRSSLLPQPSAMIQNINGKRLLCLADVRGDFDCLNRLAEDYKADIIIHTGDIGFLEQRHSLLNDHSSLTSLRAALSEKENGNEHMLSTFPSLLNHSLKLNVPVYAVSGACEDVSVLEKLRMREYHIPNLHVLDEASSYLLHIGGIKLRLFGLGGAFVLHKLFDNGDGQATIAGGQGTTWITALQMGELIDTAKKVYDPSETRLLVTHSPPGREGLLAQLALVLKADLTLSASLHFRMSASYNDFSVVPNYEVFMQKLVNGRTAVYGIYNSVRGQLEDVLDDTQRLLLANFLLVADRVPGPNHGKGVVASHEEAWKHTWHFNLSDVSVGNVLLLVQDGKLGSEIKSEGFTYSHRNQKTAALAGNEIANEGGSRGEVGVSVPHESQEIHETQQTQSKAQAGVTGMVADQTHVSHSSIHPNHIPNAPMAPATEQHTNADSIASATSPLPSQQQQQHTTNNQRKKNPNTLFIRGIPQGCIDEEVAEYFTQFKPSITAIKILIDHKTGIQRGLCYVDFNNERDMLAAEKLSGGAIRNSHLHVQVSDKNGKGFKNTHKNKKQSE